MDRALIEQTSPNSESFSVDELARRFDLEVRGTVIERTLEGADDHINKMAKKYMGLDVYPGRQPGEVRVIYKIKPERTTSMG
jgi:hypothetical protein